MPNKNKLIALEELRTNLRRDQILDAATRVFAEKGYHHATTKDIARVAGVAEGTIYLYFPSKAELLLALIEYFNQSTTQTQDLTGNLDLSLRQLLTERLKNDLAKVGPQFDLFLAIIPEVLADPNLRPGYYERVIVPALNDLSEYAQLQEDRGGIRVANIPMAVRIFLATILGLEVLHILGDDPVRRAWQNPDNLAEDIAEVMFDGLQPRKGENHERE